MSIETLIVTIDRTDGSLVKKMNIRTDAVVGNQCVENSVWEFCENGKKTVFYNTTERGIGKNRNIVLKNAQADICIFADDDMTFLDGYPETAKKAFSECPDGDVLIFNLVEKDPRRYINRKKKRIRKYNYAKYGAARIAIRRKSIVNAGISFSTEFGGGCKYCAGEDTIFLKDCLDKGLKIYAVPYALAEIDQQAESTWFKGYNDKYFCDRGALYARLYPHLSALFCMRFLFLHRKKYKGSMGVLKAMSLMHTGAEKYRKEREEQ